MPATANAAAPAATNAAAPAAHEPASGFSQVSMQQLIDQSWSWFWSHWLQITVAVAIASAIVIAMLGLRMLGLRLCQKRESWHSHWPVTIGRAISKTSFWFMVLFAAKLVDGYAEPPATLAQTINVLFTIAAALQGALWVRELILGLVENRAGGDHGGLSSAIGIIRLLVTVVLFAIATVAILDNLGVNVTGLVAGLGIGGIAIGLAAKGIFDDLFSALSIIFDRPFQRGDSIRWDKTSGTVEAIGLKTTRVRSVTGEEIVISNTNLLNKELHNLARLARRRIAFTLHVAYHTPADALAQVPKLVRQVVEDHDHCTLVRCGVTDLSLPVIEFGVEFDVRSENWDVVYAKRSAVAVALLDAFATRGIEFAGPDGKPITPPAVQPPPGTVGGPPLEAVEGAGGRKG